MRTGPRCCEAFISRCHFAANLLDVALIDEVPCHEACCWQGPKGPGGKDKG